MPINYKKELEHSAQSMILTHDPDLLINTILSRIIDKVRVNHASMLLRNKDCYLLTVSQGSLGTQIPVGLARIDKENPLVIFFSGLFPGEKLFTRREIVYREANKLLKKRSLEPKIKQLLRDVLHQMEIFDADVCIPVYFRHDLLGILLLGQKENAKRFNVDELNFFSALASNMAMAIVNAQLFKDVELALEKKHQVFIRTTIALAAAIEAKDNYTHGHTTRVTNISLGIARAMNEKHRGFFKEGFLDNLHFASLLHDIGKIGIPEYILNKEGELTEEEKNTIKKHPLIGVAILKSIKELRGSLVGIKYHHERYDGLGYPDGLQGDSIPLIASIISVADSFDAMTTDRPYRRKLSKTDAIAEIRTLRGAQFNPRVSDVFVELCQKGRL